MAPPGVKPKETSKEAPQDRAVAENRKARHEYFIDETFEAGIALVGTEVKSIRLGKVSLQDGFARVENGEVFLYNVHVSPYEQGNRFNHDPKRVRKLLLHKREIMRLLGQVRQAGFTLVPLRLYLKRGRVKVLLGLARGKRQYDKRRTIAEREAKRRIDQALRRRA